jgi:hypothetical protein
VGIDARKLANWQRGYLLDGHERVVLFSSAVATLHHIPGWVGQDRAEAGRRVGWAIGIWGAMKNAFGKKARLVHV